MPPYNLLFFANVSARAVQVKQRIFAYLLALNAVKVAFLKQKLRLFCAKRLSSFRNSLKYRVGPLRRGYIEATTMALATLSHQSALSMTRVQWGNTATSTEEFAPHKVRPGHANSHDTEEWFITRVQLAVDMPKAIALGAEEQLASAAAPEEAAVTVEGINAADPDLVL